MEFRLANLNDLPEIKNMYLRLVNKMNKNGIDIWDEVYPSEFILDDIKKKRFYVFVSENFIVGGFALCSLNDGSECIKWSEESDNVLYIDRLGVNVDYAGKGIGSMLLRDALNVARDKNVKFLRLFVVDYNKPAIRLYEKFGFKKCDGIYTLVIDENLSFNVLGFEFVV